MSRRLPTALSIPLALAALGGGVVAYAHWGERAWLQLDRYEVCIDKPGIPAQGVSILHLSDFHFRAASAMQAARLRRLERLLKGQRYDILALTGDLIHDEAGLPVALAFLDRLHPRLAAFSVPGNRDYWQSSFRSVLGTREERAGLTPIGQVRLVVRRAYRLLRTFAGNERSRFGVHANDLSVQHAALAHHGVQVLVNRAVHVRQDDLEITIAGVDDLNRGKPDVDAALRDALPDRPLVLLAHNPDVWLEEGAKDADLVLAGHTHGGQIRLPLLGAWYRQGTHLPRSQAAGWFERGASTLFVTRGVGESFPFRLGARPQAALIRLIDAQHMSA